MAQPVSALIITGYGASCEAECEYAAKQAGATTVKIAYFAELASGNISLEQYNFIIFPGGFLDGDDIGVAQAAAQRWKTTVVNGLSLVDHLKKTLDSGALVMGIGNGFQLLVKLGFLPNTQKTTEQEFSFVHNLSGKFENRWCHVAVNAQSPCVFTKGLTQFYLPVRHASGRLVASTDEGVAHLAKTNSVVMKYIDPISQKVTEEYPHNPSGVEAGVAALCDTSGRVFGLMLHPEAHIHPTNHPQWTNNGEAPLGTLLFENAVNFLKQ